MTGTVSKQEAAELLGVHRNTIRNWLNSEDPAVRIREDSEGRIPLSEIERLQKQPATEGAVATAVADAARYLEGWYNENLLAATAAVIRSCRDVTESFADMKQRRAAGGAEVVIAERFETFDRLVATVAETIQHLGAIRALRHPVLAARGESARLVRTHAKEQLQRERLLEALATFGTLSRTEQRSLLVQLAELIEMDEDPERFVGKLSDEEVEQHLAWSAEQLGQSAAPATGEETN